MKPAPFIRHVPRTLDEALKILAQVAPQDGRVLAGGQSLVPIMAFRLAKPAHLVDINEVEGLDRIASDGKMLSIGARVRHAAFHKSVVDNPLGKLLTFVARHIAHYPIRMRGTFCGSLAHADPASEWCLVAATLDATMVAKSTRGERLIAAKDYFEGIMSTALAEDELLAEVRLPLLAADAKFGFNEFNRRAGDFAMAAALVTYRLARRQDRGRACRRRRRRALPAPHCGGRSRAQRPGAGRRGFPRRGRSRSQCHRSAGGSSDHGRIPARPGARGGAARAGAFHAHDRAHQRLRAEMGRPRHPPAGRPGAGHRARPLHRRSARRALGALRAQPGRCRKDHENRHAERRDGDHRRRSQGREEDHADAAQVQLQAGRPADPGGRRRALCRRAGRRCGRGERGRTPRTSPIWSMYRHRRDHAGDRRARRA